MTVKTVSIKPILYTCLILISVTLAGQQTNVSDKLTKALQRSDSEEMSGLFAPYMMIHIQDFKKVVSAQQAKVHLSDFFKQHPNSGLTLTKSGSEDKQEYFIWNYASGEGTWRVYVLLKPEKDQKFIQQIDIEKTP